MSYPATTPMHGAGIRSRRPRRATEKRAGTWRARAAAAYQQARPTMNAEMRADMAARLLALTGQVVSPDAIFVEPHTRTAVTVIDGLVFRLMEDELMLM